jgi:hypothetical protein
MRSEPAYFAISAITASRRGETPSMAELTMRVSGMAEGSIAEPWQFHSSDSASPSSRVGTATAFLPGVQAGFPSSTSRKFPSRSSTAAAV